MKLDKLELEPTTDEGWLVCHRCGVQLNAVTGINLYKDKFYCDRCIKKVRK